MQDAAGNELEVGNYVHIQLAAPWIRAQIVELIEGGKIARPIRGMQAMTPDKIVVHVTVELPDQATPGGTHSLVVRIVDPETEMVVKRK